MDIIINGMIQMPKKEKNPIDTIACFNKIMEKISPFINKKKEKKFSTKGKWRDKFLQL